MRRSPLTQDLRRSVGGWGERLGGLQDTALILLLRPPAHQPDSLEGSGEETVICLSEHSQWENHRGPPQDRRLAEPDL